MWILRSAVFIRWRFDCAGVHHRRGEEAAMPSYGRIHMATYEECSGEDSVDVREKGEMVDAAGFGMTGLKDVQKERQIIRNLAEGIIVHI